MPLQELDFDHELGKIPASEYSLQRSELIQKGAEILRRLDELHQKIAILPEESVKKSRLNRLTISFRMMTWRI